MINKVLQSQLEKFRQEYNLDTNEEYCFSLFSEFCLRRYTNLKLENITADIINEFLFVWVSSKIEYINSNIFSCIIEQINKFLKYLELNYDIIIKNKTESDIEELNRIFTVKKELSKFLNNPVLSYKPLIIDINRYKIRKLKSNSNSFFEPRDKGYYVVIDIFSNNSIVFKKLYTGRFIKIQLNKFLVDNIKPNDIFFMEIKQTPTFSWEIDNLLKYYSSVAAQYILNKEKII